MGQYHKTVNLSRKEYLDPHQLGDGLKLREQSGWSPGGTNDALHLLLAVSNGRGGGDFAPSAWVGRWGGDRIAVIGDYAEDKDLPPEFEASKIYEQCEEGGTYTDITPQLIPVLEAAFEIVYYGDGWRNRKPLSEIFDGWEYSHRVGYGRVAQIKGETYPLDDLIARLKQHLADPERQPGFPIRVEDLPPLKSPLPPADSPEALAAFDLKS